MASCFEEAMRLIKDHNDEKYQMILLDWDMMDMDGIQNIKKIRETLPNSVPILLLSVHGSEGLEEVLKLENTGILTKPFFVSACTEKLLEMQAKSEGEHISEDNTEENLEGLHFLAAEDNMINAEILKEILSMEGADCEVVENGQLAVERFISATEDEFDAILMDVQMPVMNGYEATRAIRALDRKDAEEIPIIAMTANAFAEDQKAALDAGMNVHLPKPIDVELLKKVIRECVQERNKK